jgi:NAD(P)-dependent dehydrogenase (short-subunit alcohol dehydrogenase family)
MKPSMPLNPRIRDWKDRRVWVIGASQGIGEACARALLQRGARVAVSARSRPALEQVAGSACAGCSLVLPLDITQPAEIAAAFAALRAQWGVPDLVLIVAGTHRPVRAWELDGETERLLVGTNLMGVLNVLGAVVPELLARRRGAIGIVASVAGYRGLPTGLIYGATKAALINLAETLYLDLKPHGLDVYLINPGFVKTPLTDRNEFKMPALISAEEAAAATLNGLERGSFEIHYPKRFTRVMKLLELLPYRLYFPLIRRVTGL